MPQNNQGEQVQPNDRLSSLGAELDQISQKAKQIPPVTQEAVAEENTPQSISSVPSQDSVLPPTPTPPSPPKISKSKTGIWVLTALILLVLLGVGGYVMFGDKLVNIANPITAPAVTPAPTPVATQVPVASPSPDAMEKESTASGEMSKADKVYCGSPRPEVCAQIAIDPPPYICDSEGNSYSNSCIACANEEVEYYSLQEEPCSTAN